MFDNYINIHNNTDEPKKLSFAKTSVNLVNLKLGNLGYSVIK